jgi:hypothetical protein
MPFKNIKAFKSTKDFMNYNMDIMKGNIDNNKNEWQNIKLGFETKEISISYQARSI